MLDLIRNPTAGNLINKLKDMHTSIRQNRTVSNYLTSKGWNRLGRVAHFLGYGRRRVARRRTMRGRGFFGDVWSGIKNVGRTVGTAVMPAVAEIGKNLLVKKFGGRKRRVVRRRRTVGGRVVRRTYRTRAVGGRRRRVVRRRQTGRGLLTGVLSQLLPF
jgi:hypothetical protein